jgi:hypothetical protein
MAMNQLEILGELESMHRHLTHMHRLNKTEDAKDKVAQGAAYAYANAAFMVRKLKDKVLTKGIEIDDSDYNTL